MAGFGSHSDEKLATLLIQGDEKAFVEIYHRYWTSLYLHARKLLRDEQEAEDIIQELFTTLWSKRATILLTSSLASYLYSAVRNRVFNKIAHRKVVSDYLRSLIDFIEVGKFSADEFYREKELARIIEMEIQALPAKMREIFELSRKEHLSYREIAAQLQITEHTVKSQVSNALRILRLKLGIFAGLFVIFLD